MIVEHHVKVSSGQRQWWADCCWLVASHSVCSLQLFIVGWRYTPWNQCSTEAEQLTVVCASCLLVTAAEWIVLVFHVLQAAVQMW